MNSNGTEFSWPSYTVKVNGEEITAVKGVSWDHEVEGVEHVYGTGQKPSGRTRGRYKPGDSSITFYRSGWLYVEGGDVFTTVLEDCRIIGNGGKAEEGTDASEVEVKISFMRAVENGKELVADAA